MMNLVNIQNKQVSNVGSYIDELSKQLTKNTKKAYINDIKDFFGIKNTKDLTIEMVRNVTVTDANIFAEQLYEKGLSTSTINRKLQALSKFYSLLMRRDIRLVEYNPFDPKEGAVRFKINSYSKSKTLTKEDIELMLKELNSDKSIIGLRNRIILYLLLTTGMRRDEIANIRIGQIKQTQGKYIIEFTGKGRKERFVVLAKEIKQMIDEYLNKRGISYNDKDLPLFISHSTNADPTKPITTETIYQLIKSLSKKAGLDESISPHDFRHTYVTQSIEMGIPLETIQDRVGHSDIKTTRRYDHTLRIIKDNPADAILEIYL